MDVYASETDDIGVQLRASALKFYYLLVKANVMVSEQAYEMKLMIV